MQLLLLAELLRTFNNCSAKASQPLARSPNPLGSCRQCFELYLELTSHQSTHGSPPMAAPKLATLQLAPFQLSLRIKHPSMDPADISEELGIEPAHCFRAGQPRPSKSGLGVAAVHTESYWLAPLDPASWFGNPSFAQPLRHAITQEHVNAAIARNLTGALSLCAARFNKAHAALLDTIRSEGGEISLLVTLSSTSLSTFSLSPEVSRLFGQLGITLEIELASD